MARKPDDSVDSAAGFAFATSAYFLWGFLPLYMKALDHVPPVEVVAHRVIWSVPVAGLILVALRRTKDLRNALRSPRTIAQAALTAALISVNWMIYVWAVGAGVALDAALGYYINPLFSVLLGAVLLGERLTRAQMIAIGLATLAVVILTVENGRLPLAALGLTFTWGFYAYFKRSLPVGPNQGFLLEVLILSPFALALIVWLGLSGDAHFLAGSASDTALLLSAGVITAVPLILYANGAKLLRLSTIGMLQYIAPTMIFLVAVLLLGEDFGPAERIAFPIIWVAVAVFSWSLWRERRRQKPSAATT